MKKKNIAALVVALVGIGVLFWLSSGRELSSNWIIQDGHLDAEQMSSVIQQLEHQQLPEMVYGSPGLIDYLLDHLDSFEIDAKKQAEEKNNLLPYAQLLAAVHRIGLWDDIPGWYRSEYSSGSVSSASKFISACKKWVNHARISRWQLTAEEDELLAYIVTAARVEPDACLSENEIVSLYKGVMALKNGFYKTSSAALLQTWLSFYPEKVYDGVILGRLNSVNDLIPFVGHHDKNVALASIRTIGIYSPESALPALKSTLIRSHDVEVQLAIIDAMAGYGIRIRPYWEQLRLLQRTVEVPEVRLSIQKLIEISSGR